MASPQQPPDQPPPSQSSGWKKKGKAIFDNVGTHVNHLSNKMGAEAFWPMPLDQEADKAARILRSFCIDGFVSSKDGRSSHDDGKHSHENDKQKKGLKKVLDRIPAEVIRNAKGLAIFTTMRTGLHVSGAGGSGVIVSKLPNGQWSAPSGILIHTAGMGFVYGADIYDCVAVINNDKGMEGFTRVRCTLGGEVSAAVGPTGKGGVVDSEVFNPERRAAVWTYTKGRGLYVGVQIDGTIIVERHGENERFYGVPKVRHKQILSGEVKPPSGSMVGLWETLMECEGQVVSGQPPAYDQVAQGGGGYTGNPMPPPQQQQQQQYYTGSAMPAGQQVYPGDSKQYGYAPPPGQQGYAPPQQQHGYVMPQAQQGYAPPPQANDYGMPPAQPGYVMPPAQPGYAMPPGQQQYAMPPGPRGNADYNTGYGYSGDEKRDWRP